MSNYRRYKPSYAQSRSPRHRAPTNRIIILVVLVILVGLAARFALTRSPSKQEEQKSDDIQSLESLLRNVNVNINSLPSQNSNASVASVQKTTCSKAYSAISTTDKVVALTFDSSGIITHAQSILDELKKEGVPATFFLTGEFSAAESATVKSIADAGFAIGNHSDTHTDFGKLKATAIEKEIDDANEKIESASGKKAIPFIRPPYGSLGTGDSVVKAITDLGGCAILWTIDGQDWKQEATKESVASTVKKGLKPGAIIMLQFGHETVNDALPIIISDAKAEGYRFVSVADYFSAPQKAQ